ncbi:MAG: hypothetical protein AVDCRST_MAG73-3252, partial [uncultured Thermomicrobiales bacterium]
REAMVEGSVQQAKDTVEGTVQQARDVVEGTVQQAKDAVEDTVGTAKATVDETVQKVKESVDLVKLVEERPLLALGGALAGGFFLGKMGMGGGGQNQHPGGQSAGATQGGNAGGIRDAVKSSGLEDTLSGAMAALMGMVTEKVRSAIDETFPDVADKLKQQGTGQTAPRSAGGREAPVPIGSGSGSPPASR